MTENWIRTFHGLIDHIDDLDGVSWSDAPIPRRWHRCKPQTKGWFRDTGTVIRFACGAISPGGPDLFWMERNSRLNRQRGKR